MKAPVLALALALAAAASTDAGELRVRTNEAFAPCVRPVLAAFTRETGIAAVLDVGSPDPTAGASLVIGDDSEMTRLLEGGRADVSRAVDLGFLPWVEVMPAGSGARSLAAVPDARVTVLGGAAGRAARASLGALGGRLTVTRDPALLSSATYALVPRTFAGQGGRARPELTPLVATAAVVVGAEREPDARRLLAFLQDGKARGLLSSCLDPVASAAPTVAAPYATNVVDWWIPACSLQRNGYNDPNQLVGPPDALNLGGKDNYRGLVSLGQGGWITVDMGATVVNGAGADVRVFQATANEWVTVYASSSPAGPFTLIGLREPCGRRGLGTFSNFCEFDLAGTGVSEARYLRIEDGEIYPCLRGDTLTEGADIDAVQALNFR